ncbi:hypothetical protein VNO80_30695 [Phaseolus coccineus]|uniref:Uncharacterized protein n=1 Tax=Phaseolus coccineus TaxID=3886 RepID=A0AAN9LDM1_PHACN
MRTSPGARYADIARREVCGHRQGARGMRASPGRERHTGIVRARGMRASPGRERHRSSPRETSVVSQRETSVVSQRETSRHRGRTVQGNVHSGFPAKWVVAAACVDKLVEIQKSTSGRQRTLLWFKSDRVSLPSSFSFLSFTLRFRPYHVPAWLSTTAIEHLGDEVIQLWRVEGGSYVWVSRVKKNELDLLYESTLSYRESVDIETMYAHGCVDFTATLCGFHSGVMIFQGVELLSEWSPEGDRLFLSLCGDRLFFYFDSRSAVLGLLIGDRRFM